MGTREALRAAILRTSRRVGVSRLMRAAERKLGVVGAAALRVVNLHGTPSRHAQAFREQVEWVARRFELVSPQQFFAVARGEFAPPPRPAVMFTFDDGLRSNIEVAAPILESFGARGLFFVCPGFCELEGQAAKQFFYERVEPMTPPSADEEDWTPMSASDVRALTATGHTVGNHTFSHARLSALEPHAAAVEIDRGVEAIEAWTGARCSAFAWTFAWDAISPEAHQHARSRHEFIFGACPGTTRADRVEAALVFRTHVEADWSVDEYDFFYSGLADPFWFMRRRKLRRVMRSHPWQ